LALSHKKVSDISSRMSNDSLDMDIISSDDYISDDEKDL